MKATELRIGNLIWNPVQQCAVDVSTRELSQLEFESKYRPDMKWQWYPIPLTEGWLLKFGLIRNPTNGYFETEKMGARIWFSCHKGGCAVIINGSIEFNCEFVHQLQNLYFALTGDELEMKPKKE